MSSKSGDEIITEPYLCFFNCLSKLLTNPRKYEGSYFSIDDLEPGGGHFVCLQADHQKVVLYAKKLVM